MLELVTARRWLTVYLIYNPYRVINIIDITVSGTNRMLARTVGVRPEGLPPPLLKHTRRQTFTKYYGYGIINIINKQEVKK
jgi:hypothetical protein